MADYLADGLADHMQFRRSRGRTDDQDRGTSLRGRTTDTWLRPDAMSHCPVYSLISKSLALLAPILTLLNFVCLIKNTAPIGLFSDFHPVEAESSRNSLYFSLIAGNPLETGSRLTAHTTKTFLARSSMEEVHYTIPVGRRSM